jgi:hypothetical protein
MKKASVLSGWALCLIIGFLFACGIVYAQGPKNVEDDSNLYVHREHVTWPFPEYLLNNLRSSNDQIRLDALKLAGLTDEQAHEAVWSSGHDSPAKIISQNVVTPDRTELMYAALSEGASEQAIIAFEVRSLQSTYAAVAVQKGKGWERIAAMTCWCKYDMNPDQDMLAEFVSLRPGAESPLGKPQHYELVVHSSGGGTGIYTQYEAHFRVFRNELGNSLQFVRRFRSNIPTGPTPASVLLERRWFTMAPIANGVWGGILVEAKGTFVADRFPEIEWDVLRLQDMHLQRITCVAYRWNAESFRYERSSDAVPACQAPAN